MTKKYLTSNDVNASNLPGLYLDDEGDVWLKSPSTKLTLLVLDKVRADKAYRKQVKPQGYTFTLLHSLVEEEI